MSNIKTSVASYFSSTNSLLYSYLISLPLLLLYEGLILISQPHTEQIVRISVDVWIKSLFALAGRDLLSMTLIVAALLGLFILYRERNKLSTLRLNYFFTMLIEASIYAFFLALIISSIINNLLMIQYEPEAVESLTVLQQLALSLGAGLYEELFFRVILVGALLYLFKKLFKRVNLAYASAIILAALIFSFAHYTGELGDPFSLGSFLFRFLFGLALNIIYIWRGFGLAAWTHAIYDVMVVAYL